MKLRISLFLLLAFGISAVLRAVPTGKNVVLITIDGLRPAFYTETQFSAPAMQWLKQNGAAAQGAEVIFPSVTYPSHTSLVTGVAPARHGIVSNTLIDSQKGPLPAWFWEAQHVRVPTLHDVARRAQMATASVRWPVTLGANITYNVPEIFPMPGYYEGHEFDLTVKFTQPALMREILSATTLKRYNDAHEMDFWVAEASAYLLRAKNPRLLTVHLALADHVEHSAARSSKEVLAAVAETDRNLGIILKAVDFSRTCVVVTGDHGFADVTRTVSPNVLFAKRGWINLQGGKIMDWKVVAHSAGASAAIYVKDPALFGEVEKVLRENQSAGYAVIDRARLQQLGAFPGAFAAIEGVAGATISGAMQGELITSMDSARGTHGYLPDNPEMHTGFLAKGCGEKPGTRLGIVRMLDIAPMLAKQLGLTDREFDENVSKTPLVF